MRIYTGARKFPTVIGKVPYGKNRAKLPGGPYTLQQAMVVAIIVVIISVLVINDVGNPIYVVIIGGVVASFIVKLMMLIPFDGVPLTSRVARYLRAVSTAAVADTHPPARARESVVMDTMADLTGGRK